MSPSSFLPMVASLGSRLSTVLRRSSSDLLTWDVPETPPSRSSLTGIWSRRLDVSAAPRMSESPMSRMSSALRASSGEPTCAAISPSTYAETFASSPGSAASGICGAIAGAAVVATGDIGAGASSANTDCGAGGWSGAASVIVVLHVQVVARAIILRLAMVMEWSSILLRTVARKTVPAR